jgi:hypothetical protein
MNLSWTKPLAARLPTRVKTSPRLIALEWDGTEARIVLAHQRRGQLSVVAVASFSIPDGPEADVELQRHVRTLIDQHHFSKADCVLAVGRSAVELKYMSLPPVPDDELPELVRFQAVKEFATIGDDWPIDYLPLDSDPEKPRHVMAATLNADFVERCQRICAALQISLRSIVLRPCGMASLVCRQFTLPDLEGSLLIDPLEHQMDLAVLLGCSLVFLRSARCEVGTWNDESLSAATLEVRRTIAAASSRLAGNRLSAIYVCGDGPAHRDFAQRLQTEFGIATHRFDPFASFKATDELVEVPESERSRYAPLLGMLLDAAEQKPHILDFLRPRKKVEPPNRRREFALIGAAAAVFLMLVSGWLWIELRELDRQIADYTEKSLELDSVVKQGQELDKKIVEIDKWASSDVVWLDEFAQLAQTLPAADDLMLTQLRASAKVGGGHWQLDGLAKDVAAIDDIERRMKDPKHDVEHQASQQRIGDPRYHWTFKSSVNIQNEAPLAKKPATQPLPRPAAKN